MVHMSFYNVQGAGAFEVDMYRGASAYLWFSCSSMHSPLRHSPVIILYSSEAPEFRYSLHNAWFRCQAQETGSTLIIIGLRGRNLNQNRRFFDAHQRWPTRTSEVCTAPSLIHILLLRDTYHVYIAPGQSRRGEVQLACWKYSLPIVNVDHLQYACAGTGTFWHLQSFAGACRSREQDLFRTQRSLLTLRSACLAKRSRIHNQMLPRARCIDHW